MLADLQRWLRAGASAHAPLRLVLAKLVVGILDHLARLLEHVLVVDADGFGMSEGAAERVEMRIWKLV